MRTEVKDLLHDLTVGELLATRQYIDDLLTELQGSAKPLGAGSPTGEERRRFDRYSTNIAVTYFRHRAAASGRPAGTAVHQATVQDISRAGVRFVTAEALANDELLTLYLPGPLGVRKLFVEVVRVNRQGSRYECGATFVGLDRVFAAQKTEPEGSESIPVLLACEPSADRDVLCDLLVSQGYVAHVANSVPEACAFLERHERCLLVAAAALLLADDQGLLKAADAKKNNVLSIALVGTSEIDQPDCGPLAACCDFISDPKRSQEVRVVVARTYRRLVAAQASATDP